MDDTYFYEEAIVRRECVPGEAKAKTPVTKHHNEERKTMDKIELRLLAHQVTVDGIKFANVVYCDDAKETVYTYKIAPGIYVTKHDIVLVPRGPKNILVTAKVVDTDTTVSLDTDIRYKWLVDVVNYKVEENQRLLDDDERLREDFRKEEFKKTLNGIYNSKK